MSGLTKKTVIADRMLSAILGVQEGELVSYAQLSKGIHRYIKDNDLRNPQRVHALPPITSQASSVTIQPAPPIAARVVPPAVPAAQQKCRDCGAEIPADAVFCDLCGVRQ